MWIYRRWLDPEPGGRSVINVEDWAEIRPLHRAEGMGIKAIALVVA